MVKARSSTERRVCLLCKTALRHRSREHVFPQWLLSELSLSSIKIQAAHHMRDEATGIRPTPESCRELTLGNMTEGRICPTCNNGWMSKLEQSVKGTLIELIRARVSVDQLDQQTSLLVSRWAVKTAYMLNSSANFPIKAPASHLWALFERPSKLPWGVVVVGAKASFTDFAWCQSTVWQLCAPDFLTGRIAPLMNDRSYKIGLHFGHLVLVVTWHSIPGWQLMLWSGVQTVLWPWSGKCGWHFDPTGILTGAPAEMAVHIHGNAIKLVHPRYLAPVRRNS